ncbi:hypothetical protein EK904_003814, partial [Melospiza melodia maxima]
MDGEYYKPMADPALPPLPDPCKSLHCRPKERCRPRGAQSRCVPALVATCWAWGDPHFRTFDGLDFDFQGTCTYTMAESHGNDPGLVPFRVQAKNDIRGGIQSVSYVSLVKVDVYGQRISFHRNENGRVRVSYDWNWHLQINLSSSYYRHVRGLCGNFNLKPLDDIPEAALSSASYRGQEFLAVFPQNDDESPSAHLQLLLTSYGPADTQVSVTLRGGSVTKNITLRPDVTVPLPLPANLELTGSHTFDKTLVVQASGDISVVSVSTKGYTVGATALLPMESLGTRYYVVTPVGNYTYGLTEFVVATGATTTAISITTTATFHYAGATYVPGAVLR